MRLMKFAWKLRIDCKKILANHLKNTQVKAELNYFEPILERRLTLISVKLKEEIKKITIFTDKHEIVASIAS